MMNLFIDVDGGGPPGSLPLDPYSGNLWGAYGLQQLLTLYTGPAFRVRRSSDNAEDDIDLVAGVLDLAGLASFVGSDDGFVTKWYDQSGGGHDLVQATSAAQPKIVDGGAYVGDLLFDATNDALATAANSGAVPAFTVYVAGRNRMGGGAAESIIVHGSGARLDVARDTSQVDQFVATMVNNDSDVGVTTYLRQPVSDLSTYATIFNRAASFVSGELQYYIDGSQQTEQTSGGGASSGNYSAGTWRLGSAASTQFSRLACSSVAIYAEAHGSGTMASVSAALKPALRVDALDGLLTSVFGAYSLRHLRSAYSGDCIRARRSSDNAEQDIGFSGGVLDAASLVSFAGGGSAFVTMIYDQSGNGNHLAQATTGSQPRIVNSGVVDAGVIFDASADLLVSPNSGTPSAFTAYLKAATSFSTGAQIFLEQSANYNINTGAILYLDTSKTTVGLSQTTSLNVSRSDFDTCPAGQVLTARFDRAASGGANQAVLLSGGKLLTRASSGDSGTAPSGNFSAAPWYVGARFGAVAPSGISLETLVIYETAHSDATVDAISRGLG
jgi:hypothetical protein